MQCIEKTINLKVRIKGMKSMKFIKKKLFPKHKTVTYERFVADISPQKEETRKMRFTVEGEILGYDGEKGTELSGLETTKILVNSVI